MQNFIQILKENHLLKIIDEPVDVELEMAHLAYLEVKKENSKALLFTNAIKNNKKYNYPVLLNTFCNEKALNLSFGRSYNDISKEISSLLKMHIPQNFGAKIDFFKTLFGLKNIPPKRIKKDGLFTHQTLHSLDELPILKTWEKDAAPFITMGQVYTQSLDGKQNNLGMYRLQVVDGKTLLMHWQIHKDASLFFNDYKKANQKMPVSIAIGGDPLYIWCAQAPLPKGIFELLLYGFIRKKPAILSKCKSNNLYVPYDSDFVIEGFVDPNDFALEGPFGDHTGFYTPIESCPVLKVENIFAKKNAVYQATVVGKPPLEDKYMGLGTERIFLPLLQTNAPDLIDYNMPENGVFHNLILAQIKTQYPAHAQQIMHAFWGVGQMSFVKHAIFVDENAPKLKDYEKLIPYILNRFDESKILISEGICDQLDHASSTYCFGGKAGIDVCGEPKEIQLDKISDENLLNIFQSVDKNITNIKQYYLETFAPICVISIDKKEKISKIFERLQDHKKHFRILVFVDKNVNLNNPYMLVWRVVNNIDAKRDIFIKKDNVCIDATSKGKLEDYHKDWPLMTDCSKDIIEKLISKKLLKKDEDFFEKFEIF
ncbi:menaquinone biosynthesis decarboxylase [Campylobacter insulaenigrae]|uniref:Menaquinone biosynthesis decarboxylase n=1 Tax=Campylobacter insulaenigrae TaxID=260714 RepID=A0ABY3G2P0_9BACT|nr:menaquinone biosynthesis decarboxylase [Campylobacter insulaenigrae]TWO23886.1 menaquinone biosynthesis decarboxylase [Campylobacter insulaenigrae]